MANDQARITAREWLFHAALLVLLLACAFPATFLRGEMISAGDLLFWSPPWNLYAPEGWERPQNPLTSDVITAFIPFYAITQKALADGEWPLWNHLEQGGMPLMANCQSAVFYPPRLLHCLLDLHVATTLYVLLKLWLCGMTAYFCARVFRLGVPAARFASVGWMLGSYNLIFCLWPLPDVSAWLPLVLAGAELSLNGLLGRGFFTLALGGTLLLLAGHPESAFGMSVGVGVYFLARLMLERRWGRRLWGPVAVCGAAWAVALLVCAVQIAPFVEYLVNSHTFGARPHLGRPTWLPPSFALGFWQPRFFGTPMDYNYWGGVTSNRFSMLYPGWAVWFGIALLLGRGSRPSLQLSGAQSRQTSPTTPTRPTGPTLLLHDARAPSLAIAAGISALLTFNAPPFDGLQKLPGVSSMIASWYAGFAVFAMPLLGAMGINRWLAQRRPLKQLLWTMIPILVSVALSALLLSFFAGIIRAKGLGAYTWTQLIIGWACAGATLVVFAACSFWKKPRWGLLLVTLALAADLLVANRDRNPHMPRRHLYLDTELTRFMQQQKPPCRFGVAQGGIVSGLVAAYGIEEWLGYDGLYPARYTEFHDALRTDFWNAMEPACAIEYYLYDPRFPPDYPLREEGRFEYVTTLDRIEVYRNLRAFPRAYLVGGTLVVPDRQRLYQMMKAPTFDPARTALLEAPLTVSLPEQGPKHVGKAEVLEYSSTRARVRAEANQDAVLVLADAYYPGWEARMNNQRVPIFPVYGLLRGIVVPKGVHEIVFGHCPMSFVVGLGVSSAVLCASALAAGAWLFKHRRCRRPG